jgi:mannan endo-1,4-beta-mannosidase
MQHCYIRLFLLIK